jgi:serine/threonine protein kinase
MGRVWLGYDEVLRRDVAVKEVVPPPGLTAAEKDMSNERSLREARAIARLNHPNVVRIYDVVSRHPWPWIVMEYVPSRSLHQVIDEDGPLPPTEVARIGLAVLAALYAAHRAGIVHRDVKPSNVLLSDQRVVLTDWGLATMEGDATVTHTGMIIGSPAYISPERARDGTYSPASDLWSLGATLYAAVEGRAPFERTSAIATLTALATEDFEPPVHAGPLRPVLDGLLAKDPAHRMGPFEAERALRRALGRTKARAKTAPWRAPRPRATAEGIPPLPPPSDEKTAIVSAGSAEPISGVPVSGAPVSAPPVSAPPVSPATSGDLAATAVEAAPTEVVDRPHAGRLAPPQAGRPAPPDEDPVVVRDHHRARRWILLVAIALELLLVAILGTAFLLRDTGKPAPPRPAPTGTGAPAPAASRGGSAPPAATTAAAAPGSQLPAGWHYHKDPSGFTVAVPDGWSVSVRDGIVYFRDPQGGRLLGIDQTNRPQPDPVADWRSQESRRVAAGDFPGYQLIGIRSVDYHVRAADWEFTYNGRGGRKHVINRGAIFNDHQAYGFYWETPADQWDANLPAFQLITGTFQGKP